ncbi:MAG: glycosyltransferase [Verrucomicrobiota bacterium]
MPLVTVLVPTFNRPALLRQAVLSACRQSHRGLENFVLDDLRDLEFVATLMPPLEAGPGLMPVFCDPKAWTPTTATTPR